MKNLSSIIFIILAVALFFLYIKPEWQVVSDLRAQKTSYENGLVQAKQAQSIRDDLVTKYNAISDVDKTKLSQIIPEVFMPARIASDISIRAAQDKLVFKGMSVALSSDSSQPSTVRVVTASVAETGPMFGTVVTPSATYQTQVLTINVIGSYSNFLYFLKDIESNVQIMDVTKIDISGGSQSGSGSSSDLDFKVQAKAYSLK